MFRSETVWVVVLVGFWVDPANPNLTLEVCNVVRNSCVLYRRCRVEVTTLAPGGGRGGRVPHHALTFRRPFLGLGFGVVTPVLLDEYRVTVFRGGK